MRKEALQAKLRSHAPKHLALPLGSAGCRAQQLRQALCHRRRELEARAREAAGEKHAGVLRVPPHDHLEVRSALIEAAHEARVLPGVEPGHLLTGEALHAVPSELVQVELLRVVELLAHMRQLVLQGSPLLGHLELLGVQQGALAVEAYLHSGRAAVGEPYVRCRVKVLAATVGAQPLVSCLAPREEREGVPIVRRRALSSHELDCLLVRDEQRHTREASPR
mmetsp:Transcript_93047/g.290031  ORF Transcript_93047/g.290031 Transcript_93047/m.290031 type:complete len:222 (+) Transcript_93047:83-748(+)